MKASHGLIPVALLSGTACKQSPKAHAEEPALPGLPDTLPASPGSITVPASFTRSADSAGQRRFHVVNRRFLSTRLYHRDRGESRPLVLETVEQSCCIG